MSRPRSSSPDRIPVWQLVLLGFVRAFQGVVIFPLKRMFTSDDPIDAYGLNHLTSVAGDAMLVVALSDSVFFSVPVDDARIKLAAYLALTMLPLALAGPAIVPILDRAGPRRSVTAAAAAGRALLALLLASELDSALLYPLALLILVFARVHGIVKNGLTMAYASEDEGLLRANARLGRVAVAGAIAGAVLGVVLLFAFGSTGPVYGAAIVWIGSALLTSRLPRPTRRGSRARYVEGSRGRIPELTMPALGAVGMRAAAGFLLFLMAFALRSAEVPAYWFAVIGAAGLAGGFLADIVAPAMNRHTRAEAVVIASVSAAFLGAILASQLFGLPLLSVYAFTAGAATEFSRLAFQSLMQRAAPEGALGRVFVRYEVMFQLAWVTGAFLPVLLPISFRTGILMLALFFGVIAGVTWWRDRRRRRGTMHEAVGE